MSPEVLSATTKGFITCGSLIVAIGAQNAFVLTQSLKKQYGGSIAVTCILIDCVLIFAGVAGLGLLIADKPVWLLTASLGGAVFLTGYGALSLRAACADNAMSQTGTNLSSRRNAVMVTAAISLLNPHVYLDTVLLIGSIGGQYAEPFRYWFILGASTASALWFLGLVYGAGRLAVLFSRPSTWRLLNGLIGLIMLSIAWTLWHRAVQIATSSII